tara:strand:+ start:2134 stop:3369 length:1236 start_codon:yes stop_codon:yes gene_type:complete
LRSNPSITDHNFFKSYKIKAILIAFFFNFAISNSFSDDLQKCLWVKSSELTSDNKIENLISNAYRSGYKIIFLQVDIHQDSRYNPYLETISVEPKFDPLKSALYWANWYDLEIHLWLNMYKIWSSTWAPPENHIYYKLNDIHKDWFSSDINGHIDCDIQFNISEKKVLDSEGFQGIFLSPFNLDAQKYLTNIIINLIEKYKNSGQPSFSGIHLDYFRYKDSMYGYNYKGRKLFYDKYNIDPIYLNKISNWANKDSSLNLMNEWNLLKSKQIDDFLYNISEIIKTYQNLKLSVAVKSNIYEAKIRWHQDWDNWIYLDYIDFVVVMNYYNDTESFSNNLWDIYKYFDDKKNINKIYIGISTLDDNLGVTQLRNSSIIRSQINNTKDFSFPGLAIFSSEYFNFNPSLYLEIFNE